MEKADLQELKIKVPCAAVLEREGFVLDAKESTRRAMKYRRDAAIIIVIHGGKGWFDPLSEGKGDVFGLVEHLKGGCFLEALNEVANLVGSVPSEPTWQCEPRDREPGLTIAARWRKPACARAWLGDLALFARCPLSAGTCHRRGDRR